MGEGSYIGIDVGTGSVRAGVFDARGRRLGMGAREIRIFRPEEDHVEQSSDDIWEAAGVAVRAALREAGLGPEAVRGIGFDATCSLVALDAADRPVTVSATGDDRQNVIVWMDHRAVEQARRINEGRHGVLRYVGGVISPEMETPKLLWLKERLPAAYARAARFLDLADFMTYRATGSDVRSLCTTTCKWTYLGHEGGVGWDAGYFRAIGLGDLADEGFARIGGSGRRARHVERDPEPRVWTGTRVRPMGERAGGLTAAAAAERGLAPGTAVAGSIIDAHAGGLGLLGAPLDGAAPT
ncbi:MAG: ribulokinase, partial [Polyangiaceae bacterium]|nr:ribulokinase [Polyangiaceae bacterium]